MHARIAALAAAALFSAAAHALPEYTIARVIPATAFGHAFGVSRDGTVVGCMTLAGDTQSHAFKWKDGVNTDLGPGCATAINNNGVIAGRDATNNLQVWNGGTVTPLGINGDAAGINDSGTVAGTYKASDGTSYAFTWSNGQVTNIATGASIFATAINAAGHVVYNAGGNAFLYRDGSSMPIPGINGTSASPANAINDKDWIVGQGSDHGPAPYIYKDGVTTRLAGSYAGAVAINNPGQVIGSGEGVYGYLIDLDGSTHSLSTLATNASGYSHLEAEQINDAGWIAGYGNCPDTSPCAYVMIPKAAGGTGTATSLSAAPPLAMRANSKSDFNADRQGDLLWRSSSNQYGMWLMNGGNIGTASVIAAPEGGTVVLRADFDGDGRTDLLWTDASGAYYVSLVSGTSLVTSRVLDAGSGSTAVGTGDFNGDGRADVLWWNAAQGYSVWLMAGASAQQTSFVAFPPTAQVPSVIADFDGDGRDDILWRGDDGHFELYTMNGVDATAAGTVRAAGTGFVPVAIGDFNGDRKADIVWAKPDGTHSMWLMNGATPVNSTSLIGAGTGWHVAFAADFDGDGMSDLAWVHADGSAGGWLMSGTTTRAYAAFIGANSGWSLIGATDLDGNGTADLLWRATDGSYGFWMMNGLTATSHAVLLGGGSGWELVP